MKKPATSPALHPFCLRVGKEVVCQACRYRQRGKPSWLLAPALFWWVLLRAFLRQLEVFCFSFLLLYFGFLLIGVTLFGKSDSTPVFLKYVGVSRKTF